MTNAMLAEDALPGWLEGVDEYVIDENYTASWSTFYAATREYESIEFPEDPALFADEFASLESLATTISERWSAQVGCHRTSSTTPWTARPAKRTSTETPSSIGWTAMDHPRARRTQTVVAASKTSVFLLVNSSRDFRWPTACLSWSS